MSLFPAFNSNDSTKNEIENAKEKNAGPSWLNNSSFSISEKKTSPVPSTSSESSDENAREKKYTRHCSKKKKKKKRNSEKEMKEHVQSKLFYEDSKAMKSNSGFVVPQVKLTKPATSYDVEKKKKRKKIKKNKSRYFQKKIEEENEERKSLRNPEPMEIQEFLKHTELFNQTLRNEPHNINIWLNYVRLQDSGIGSIRGRGEKKLSILDKALEANPDADELLHEKMTITESIFPLDKVAAEAKSIVSKYPKNVVGWQWVINSLQYSLSKMAAPGVLLNYEKALEGINKAHHDSNHFMEQLEDSIITSGLPLGALWLRIERLREGIYFLPVDESSDPQRMVFREDLTHLLFPITRSCSTRLIMNCLLLLKVPPLPLSDAFYKYTRLNNIPWSLDSVEIILAANFSKFSGKEDYLDVIQELLSGPQYLVDSLGQNQFFDFVNSVFEKCIMYSQADSTCFLVWQLKWWRWIYLIQKIKDSQVKDLLRKRFISDAKKILKQHRDCIPLYIEYALLEYVVGDLSSCLKVLETTMHMRSPPLMAGTLEKKNLCLLYKEYVEILIKEDINLYKEKILVALIALAFGEPIKNIVPREDLLTKCNEKFTHISTEILCDVSGADVELSGIIFPDYIVSWLSCHAWFAYIHEGIKRSTEILENAIQQLDKIADSKNGNLITVMLEQLYESLVNITLLYCSSIPGHFSVLHDLLLRAVEHFPNNAVFFNAIYNCDIVGIKWQKMTSLILSSDSALASAFVYFITHTRLLKEQSMKIGVCSRLHSLLERLRNSFERCPLFWRLQLQASSYKDAEDIKRIFYRTVEKCPWVKLLYYEAAKILPEDLPEIQDLLVEKELRLHITPEELEILREGS